MNLNKEAILYGIIGLLAGSLITIILATTAVNHHNNSMMRMMGIHTNGQGYNMMNTNNSNMNMDMGGH